MVSLSAGADAVSAVADLAGVLRGGSGMSARKQAEYNREMAKNAIRWRVEDAKAAGLHPLAALGANVATSNPVTVGGNDDSRWDSLSRAGQNIARAASHFNTAEERANKKMADSLTLQKMALENKLLESQITNISKPTTPAIGHGSHLIDGQGNVAILPSEQIASHPGDLPRQAGTINTFQVDAAGGIVPSEQMKNRIDDDFIGSTLWHLKNRVVRPDLPDGRKWNPILQKYKKPKYFMKKLFYW